MIKGHSAVFRLMSLLIAAAALLCALTSCDTSGGAGTDGTAASRQDGTSAVSGSDISGGGKSITVGFVGNDSLNPFRAASEINRQLMYLIYDGLFYLSADYSVQPLLASDAEVTDSAVVVRLKDGAVFSDGSAVTGECVVNSFNLAKASPLYAAQLVNFTSCMSNGSKLTFVTASEDVNAAACLTFPIIKADADEPVGAGRYILREENAVKYLELNRKNARFSISLNGRLGLCDVSLISTEEYAFMTGKTSVYLDTLDDGEYTKLSSKTCSVQSGNLVFIGLNCTNTSSVMSLEYVRRAINIGLDRNSVGGSPFRGQSLPAETPFPSSYYALNGLELNPDSGDRERAVKVLEEEGFTAVNASGVRSNGRIALRASVLVPTESEPKRLAAEALKTDLARLGIIITVKQLPYEEYKAAIASGAYEMYVGEIKLTDNFPLDAFFRSGGIANTGITADAAAAYYSYKKGEMSFSEYIESFYTSVPFIPLCYRQYVVSYDESLSGVESAAGDLFYSIYSWE